MTIIKGIEFDTSRSTHNEFDWSMVFTGGTFQMPGAVKIVSDFIINLNRNDYKCEGMGACMYHIFFNPRTDNYTIQTVDDIDPDSCNTPGYLIGGFQVKGCDLIFLPPGNCDGVEYQRTFTSEFTKAYRRTEIECDMDTCGGDFDLDAFGSDFDKECPIISGPEGEFRHASFNDGFKI